MSDLASMGGDPAADDDARGAGETLAPVPYDLGEPSGPLTLEELRRIVAGFKGGALAVRAPPLDVEPEGDGALRIGAEQPIDVFQGRDDVVTLV